MIDINQLKQGDELTVYENGKHIHTLIFISKFYDGFVAKDPNGDIEEWSDKYLNYFTSWKRDGVELLKQEEEKPLYVFCPIEKGKDSFYIKWEKDKYPIYRLGVLANFCEYTFIGYSNSDDQEDFTYFDSPVDKDIYSSNIFVSKYTVFMLTSELHVGGE